MMKPVELQDSLKQNKNLITYTNEEFEYFTTALGLAAYSKEKDDPDEVIPHPPTTNKKDKYKGLQDNLNRIDNPDYNPSIKGEIIKKEDKKEKKITFPIIDPYQRKERLAKPSDRIECELCGKIISRSNRARHNKTNYHQVFAQANKKLVHLMHPKLKVEIVK